MKDPVYDAEMFRQKFRMSKPLFLRILENVQNLTHILCKIRRHWPIGVEWLGQMYNRNVYFNYGIASDATNEYV